MLDIINNKHTIYIWYDILNVITTDSPKNLVTLHQKGFVNLKFAKNDSKYINNLPILNLLPHEINII